MTELGVHWRNGVLAGDDFARTIALGCHTHLVYVTDKSLVPYWRSVCSDIRRVDPGGTIHLRIEKRGALGNAVQEALEAASIAEQFKGLISTFSWRNEPNQELPSDTTPEVWQAHHTIFLTEGQKLTTIPLYATAVSPAPTPRAIAFMNATAAAAKAAKARGWYGHFYGTVAQATADMDRHRALWDGPLVGTEYNFGAGNAYDLRQYVLDIPQVCQAAADRNISALCPFIWYWQNPDSHLITSVNIKDTLVENAMKTMSKVYTSQLPIPPAPPPGGGGNMTEAEFERLCANIWFDAGVLYNPNGGFAKFWRAEYRAGRYIGRPERQEHKSENGQYYLQEFAAASLWSPVSNPADVKKGLPPFS